MISNRYELVIEFDNFITRYELDYILTSIDRIIEQELLYPSLRRGRPKSSYIGITGVSTGSIDLEIIVGAVVTKYVATRLKRGFDRGPLDSEIEHSGQIVNSALAGLLGKINDWAEKYVQSSKHKGGQINKVIMRKKKPSEKSR